MTLKNNFERDVQRQIRKGKCKVKYETVSIPYTLKGRYKPDFIVTTPTGVQLYIEAKGYFRPEHKRKMKAVKQQHPSLDIRIIFFRRDISNIRWCEKYGFPYAFGSIPEDWLK